jgi:general secretion pathway protein L
MPGVNEAGQRMREAFAFARQRGGAFLAWWLAELRDMIPAGVKRRLGVFSEYTIAHLADDRITVQHWDAAGALTTQTVEIGEQRNNLIASLPAGKPVFASIGIESALTGTMTVPAAAEMRLSQAVAFEIERLCPFRIADARFDYAVTGRDRTARALTVEWAVVPSALVERCREAVSKLGLEAFAIGVAGAQPRSPRYTFARYRQARPLRIGRPAAALIAGGLFFAFAAAYAGYASEAGRQHILAQIEASKAKAEQAKALRTQTQAMTAAIARLAGKTQSPTPALILAELAQVLPDETWVQKFSLNGAEVRLIGVSTAASELIERLAASPLLRNPRFQAPITVAGGTQDKGKLESFDIAVTVQAPKPAGPKP